MFSNCSGECCVCGSGDFCLAGNGEDGFYPAKKEAIIKRLDENKYKSYRDYMIKYLKREYNIDYKEKA